jgi:mannonate dehydratase
VTNTAEDDTVPHEELPSTSKYIRYTPMLFEPVREAHHWDIVLLHDAHNRHLPIAAACVGNDLKFARLFWQKDTVAAKHQEVFA